MGVVGFEFIHLAFWDAISWEAAADARARKIHRTMYEGQFSLPGVEFGDPPPHALCNNVMIY